MIKSMTGFGRAEVHKEGKTFNVEIKSVNHRYLDFNVKMPKRFSFFESNIRNLLKGYMQRGKVDIFITYEEEVGTRLSLKYNEELAIQYLTYFKQMESLGIENDIRVSHLSRYPEVFTMEEQSVDDKELWSILEKALNQAAEAFAHSRMLEGEALQKDLLEKLDSMKSKIQIIEEYSPSVLTAYREKLEQKVKDLFSDSQMEESRIAAEVVIYADKICTDEETVRLLSHIDTMKQVLQESESIGRKLDFIAQEMNREANTILSKANDIKISNIAIDLKTEIEKVREQIQNIE